MYFYVQVRKMNYIYTMITALLQSADLLFLSGAAHITGGMFLFGADFTAIANDGALRWFVRWGLVLAIIVMFWKTLRAMAGEVVKLINCFLNGTLRGAKMSHYQLMFLYGFAALLPMIAGLFIRSRVQGWLTSPITMGLLSMLNAGFLFMATHSVEAGKKMKDMSAVQGVKLGLFSLIGILPGISRSGAIYAAGRNMGFTQAVMGEFTFVLLLLTMLGSLVVDFGTMTAALSMEKAGLYLVATLFAAAVGCGIIYLLQNLMKRQKFGRLMVYALVFGAVLMILGWIL